jgi:hypothetical protein
MLLGQGYGIILGKSWGVITIIELGKTIRSGEHFFLVKYRPEFGRGDKSK